MLNGRDFLAAAGLTAYGMRGKARLAPAGTAAPNERVVTVDRQATAGDLPHNWEKAAVSDRTAAGLRTERSQNLVRAHRGTGIQSMRCHGLFDDQVGIVQNGAGRSTFLYVDQVYVLMPDHRVRPPVELSFMPEALASSARRVFACKGNTSPPRTRNHWHDRVQTFTNRCAKRCGIAEVSNWRFAVGNGPIISFRGGPSRTTLRSIASPSRPSTQPPSGAPPLQGDSSRYCSTVSSALQGLRRNGEMLALRSAVG